VKPAFFGRPEQTDKLPPPKKGPHFKHFVLTYHLGSQLTSSVAANEAGILAHAKQTNNLHAKKRDLIIKHFVSTPHLRSQLTSNVATCETGILDPPTHPDTGYYV
jgi:hypothetical protein